jgi:hypothetical protein
MGKKNLQITWSCSLKNNIALRDNRTHMYWRTKSCSLGKYTVVVCFRKECSSFSSKTKIFMIKGFGPNNFHFKVCKVINHYAWPLSLQKDSILIILNTIIEIEGPKKYLRINFSFGNHYEPVYFVHQRLSCISFVAFIYLFCCISFLPIP